MNIHLGVVEMLLTRNPNEDVQGLIYGDRRRARRDEESCGLAFAVLSLALPLVEADWRRGTLRRREHTCPYVDPVGDSLVE
jgi:hypothetical protein